MEGSSQLACSPFPRATDEDNHGKRKRARRRPEVIPKNERWRRTGQARKMKKKGDQNRRKTYPNFRARCPNVFQMASEAHKNSPGSAREPPKNALGGPGVASRPPGPPPKKRKRFGPPTPVSHFWKSYEIVLALEFWQDSLQKRLSRWSSGTRVVP